MSRKRAPDRLAEIAAEGGSFERERLEEPRPPDLPGLVLPNLRAGGSRGFIPRLASTPETLQSELEALRGRMAPFLRNCAPPLTNHRRRIGVDRAMWRLDPSSSWSEVRLPHYGPPMGRARAWYRLEIALEKVDLEVGTVWVCFGGVDYKAAVFFNGELAGTHEGFFSPFEFDVTSAARLGTNEILVRVDNDAICMGNDSWGHPAEGDKIYGATGLGWDEPGSGWHHCPPGMGIHRPVHIECRPRIFVHDLFVRPLPGESCAEAWIEVHQTGNRPDRVQLSLAVHGANFDVNAQEIAVPTDLPAAPPGVTCYKIPFEVIDARKWTPDDPWMYSLQVTLESGDLVDTAACEFGLRSFLIEENPRAEGWRGRLYLNGAPVRLRGANTMGHEQQCVFRGDLAQLQDDILLAKLANMNFLRLTQRPVEPEVYHMCDRLGLMLQTDLPLFGFLRRTQFAEALRQAVEMERLVRHHPSNILVSFINEPFSTAKKGKSHRHLSREELEGFFEAARLAMRVENPDRQIKPVDGDYAPPAPGLPDNHCYTAWYNGHGLDIGRLHKGFWMPVKPGWCYACGEFGAEGLDPEDLMLERYPPEWLPKPHETWSPTSIARAQTGTYGLMWIERGTSIGEWVKRSQAHQAWATRMMTEAFRRDDRMVSFAIHLFIDAWPAGWMKAIMDCRRVPKPAYFAYREALAPLAVSLRLDRTSFWEGEAIAPELWLLNDPASTPEDLALAWQVVDCNGRVLGSERIPARPLPAAPAFQGRVQFVIPSLPPNQRRGRIAIQAAILRSGDEVVHDATLDLSVFKKPPQPDRHAALMGEAGGDLAWLLPEGWIVCSDPQHLQDALAAAARGCSVLLLGFPEGTYHVGDSDVVVKKCGMGPRHFVGRAVEHPATRDLEENDFRFWYDAAFDRVTPLLHSLAFAEAPWNPVLEVFEVDWNEPARCACAVAERAFGQGRLVFCVLELSGRLTNPAAVLLLDALASLFPPHRKDVTANRLPPVLQPR